MALRNLGIEHEVVAISEFDKYADASYQAIHGETWNMGDITKIDVDDVPDHDLFTYSFPCQDISVAGKGKGFSKDSGTRSGLLWESERIIKAKKPKYLLMENVKNLIGKKFIPGFVEWIRALEELGYSNYYEVLNAKDFGIPQNRERVFMVSILGEHEPYVFPKPIKLEKRLKDVLEDEVDEKYYLDDERARQLIVTMTDGNEIGYVPYKEGGKQHQSNTVYDREEVAPTIEARDYKGAKQIIEPKVAASRGRGKNNEQQLEVNKDDTSNALTTVEKDNYVVEPNDDDIKPINPLKGKTNNGWHFEQEVYDDKGIARALKAGGGSGNIPKTIEGIPIKNNTDQGYLIAKEKFGRMGEQAVRTQNKLRLPHGETLNPWNEEQSSVNGVSPTLTTRPEGFKTAINVTDQYRIRKLTPLECFRLMGVTDEDFYKAQAVNSNSQLYKQAGNSIVVSVLEAIFRNMFLEVPEEDLVGEHIPLF